LSFRSGNPGFPGFPEDEYTGGGRSPRKTLFRLVPVAVVLVIALIIALLTVTWASTGVKEIGLHYSGGPIEGQSFDGIIAPGQPIRPIGLADEVIKLPVNQRTYIVGKTAGADSGVVTATNANGNKVEFETSMTFELNTDPDVVSSFYEDICTKYQNCQDTGWNLMLDDYLRKVQETVLQSVSRSIESETMAQDPDVLANIGTQVNERLQAQIERSMGGNYLEVSEFQVNNLHLPDSVIQEYETLTARQVETQQAEQKAKTAKAFQATLENNPKYLELQQVEAFTKAVEKGQVEFWVLPPEMAMNAPSPSP
jgi:regulator of protease activity HflC (stomatin/prohibitin superfamily)